MNKINLEKKSSKQISFVDKRAAEIWESGAWSFFIWIGYIASWIMVGLAFLFLFSDRRWDIFLTLFLFGLVVFLVLFFLKRKLKRGLLRKGLIKG